MGVFRDLVARAMDKKYHDDNWAWRWDSPQLHDVANPAWHRSDKEIQEPDSPALVFWYTPPAVFLFG